MDAAQSSRASLLPSRRSKRRRTSTASCSFCAAQRSAGRAKLAVSERAPVSYLATTITYTRDWADLGDGPAGLIANRVLAYDVADYVRFRAVCSSWRRCCAEPLAHGGLDRRFHPWRWMMLQERHSTTNCRRFLNTSTGECIQVDIPELRDHNVLAVTHESLLVLLHVDTNLRLLNPLTRHLTQLPPLLTLLSPEECHDLIPSRNLHNKFKAWGSGILNDDSTVVLRFKFNTRYIGIAKPGDMCWTRLETPVLRAASMFAGRFYCFTKDGIMVLKDQPPRLEVAAKLHIRVSGVCDSAHLVDCAGELMLVHRRFSRHYDRNNVAERRYDAYRVDFDAGTLCRVKCFGGGGHALFIGMTCSFSVPIEGFPIGSISGDTIYLNVDIDESDKTEGYSLADRTITPAVRSHHWAAQPYTLVNCLAFCNTHIWSGLK